jgi:hypothetical protein
MKGDRDMRIRLEVILSSIVFSLILISGCTDANGDTPTDANNVFFISGKNYAVTDSLLAQFRKSWHESNTSKITTVLAGDDRQWVFDYIAVDQGTRTPACNKLTLLEIRPRPTKTDTFDGKVLTAGGIDEAWSLIACGKQLTYRVAVLIGTDNLAVYEMNQHLPLSPDAIP